MADSDRRDRFQLDGKVALISGAARGIGFAIAQVLIDAGASVVLGDILQEKGHAAADRLGAKALFVKLDVTQESDWEAACAAAVEKFGGLDIVCNNAAVEHTALFENCEVEDFRRIQEVNCTGVFLGTKHAIRTMKPGGLSGRGGSIINTSSSAGFKGVIALGAYCATKGSVRLLSKAAAVECGRLNYGIRVNTVHPGLVKTEMGIKTLHDYVALGIVENEDAAEKAFHNAHLLGLGQPEDIADAVRFLASDASKWVTGIELPVDGGYNVA